MKNKITWVVVLVVLVILGILLLKPKAVDTTNRVKSEISTKACGFEVSEIAVNSKVTFPLTIKGNIDNSDKSLGCTWTMFEGQAGTVQVFYRDNNVWKNVGVTPIPVENWQSEKTSYTVTVDLPVSRPSGSEMKLLFSEEDPSGRGNVDTLELPVYLQ